MHNSNSEVIIKFEIILQFEHIFMFCIFLIFFFYDYTDIIVRQQDSAEVIDVIQDQLRIIQTRTERASFENLKIEKTIEELNSGFGTFKDMIYSNR